MSKLRDGPGKVRPTFYISDWSAEEIVLILAAERDTTARTPDTQAEADVRGPAHAATTADLEHGAGSNDDGEPEEYGELRRGNLEDFNDLVAQMATVDAMRIANKEMKKQYKGINIDKIEVGLSH